MAAIAHPLAGPLANNPHWNQAPGTGHGSPAQPLSRNRLDPDFNLVERCLSGDEAAWEALVRTHTRRVYGFCYRFTGKDSEAQDLTQEVFLRVFRSLKSYRSDDGDFGAPRRPAGGKGSQRTAAGRLAAPVAGPARGRHSARPAGAGVSRDRRSPEGRAE